MTDAERLAALTQHCAMLELRLDALADCARARYPDVIKAEDGWDRMAADLANAENKQCRQRHKALVDWLRGK